MSEEKPHKNQKHFAGGIDNGFGNYKLLLEGHELVVIPSYLSETKMEAVPGRVRLGNKEFTVGHSASRVGQNYSRNVDDAVNKIEYALLMLLGALAHLPHRKEWHLRLAASIHDHKNLKDRLIDALSGTHDCILAGEPEPSRVLIEVTKVLPEGVGALYKRKVPAKHTMLDFGNGTTLLSRYFEGKLESHEPLPCGVEQLINLISVEMKSILNGFPGELHLIRAGLESGSLSYTRSISFKNIYKQCLSQWFEQYLRKVVNRAKDSYEQGDEVLCIGGGCLLPGFKKFLEKGGFQVHESPLDANVQGLLKIAQSAKHKVLKNKG